MENAAATSSLLTPQEIQTFKRDGWFMRRSILDPSLCARCRDLVWETPGTHPARMVRYDPSTHVGPFRTGDGEGCSGYRWFPRRSVLAIDDAFIQLLPKNPRVKAIAEQLLGVGEVAEVNQSSGVYGTLPMGALPKQPQTCHIDSWLDYRQRLSCVAYIDDVKPHGGSFMVWPGSHRKCHAFLTTEACRSRNGYGQPPKQQKNLSGGPDHRPTWAAGMERAHRWCMENIVPVDTWAPAGTVVFYHARLAHHASGNYSDRIRQAVLISFSKTVEALPDEECLEHARTNSIWREWSQLVRESPIAGGETEDDRHWTEQADHHAQGLTFTETGFMPLRSGSTSRSGVEPASISGEPEPGRRRHRL